MLAQSFLTAAELGLNDTEHGALLNVLGMLERGEIEGGQFDMNYVWFTKNCNTPACLCGWAQFVSDGRAFPPTRRYTGEPDWERLPDGLLGLFSYGNCAPGESRHAKPAQAAIALRNYLTTGKANWAEAMS